jgi:hypothetical protein
LKHSKWNVCTLCANGKLANAVREIENYQIRIHGLSEGMWPGQGRIDKERHAFPYIREENHQHGIGLLFDSKGSKALIGWNPVSDRKVTGRFYE